ncbi:MORN repeat-containing protein 5-like [Nymphalis io]|uniref:MORN repeat-containing protein 5-like n=1 Tax=Inachis io TaxID=171585 RepID=UPI002168D3F1|nr:MORN repeat-containing protein 5-like [Nymphalis io]
MSINKWRESTEASTKRVSQWENLMRKFSEAHNEECKTISLDIPRVLRSMKKFPTGSQYEGTWDMLGMSGYGVYKFLNGVVYEGEFDDGMFHGDGQLIYPNGTVLHGTWNKGQLTERRLIFADGLEYSEIDWKYCRMPDRRYTIEYDNGFKPAGQSYLTADQPTRPVPPGYYDTGDGFYDPKTKVVYKAEDLNTIIRSPSVREQKWIIDNCRTSPDLPLGPRKDLYEEWLEPQVKLIKPPPPASTSRATESAQPLRDLEPEIGDGRESIFWRKSSSRWNQRPLIKFDTLI